MVLTTSELLFRAFQPIKFRWIFILALLLQICGLKVILKYAVIGFDKIPEYAMAGYFTTYDLMMDVNFTADLIFVVV